MIETPIIQSLSSEPVLLELRHYLLYDPCNL